MGGCDYFVVKRTALHLSQKIPHATFTKSNKKVCQQKMLEIKKKIPQKSKCNLINLSVIKSILFELQTLILVVRLRQVFS